MEITTPRRRGPGLRLEIGVVGAVILALVLMVGAAQGIGHLTSRQWAQMEEVGSWPDVNEYMHDGSVTLKNGSSWLDATDLYEVDVTTDGADFEIRYVDTNSATLDVEGETRPNQQWVLQREGQRLTVSVQWDPESQLGGTDAVLEGGTDVGSAAMGEAAASEQASPPMDADPVAGPTDTPTADSTASATADPSADPAVHPTATASDQSTPQADGTTPQPAETPPTDTGEPKLAQVTLTLPESLRSESGTNTYRVLGGSLTTAKSFGATNVILLGGAANIGGEARYFSAKVASGTLEFSLNDSESIDLDVSGDASITGEFAGFGPQYLYTLLNGGAMDLTLSKDMTSYEVRVDNQFGELNNLLKDSANAQGNQYPELVIEGSMTGGSLTLR